MFGDHLEVVHTAHNTELNPLTGATGVLTKLRTDLLAETGKKTLILVRPSPVPELVSLFACIWLAASRASDSLEGDFTTACSAGKRHRRMIVGLTTTSRNFVSSISAFVGGHVPGSNEQMVPPLSKSSLAGKPKLLDQVRQLLRRDTRIWLRGRDPTGGNGERRGSIPQPILFSLFAPVDFPMRSGGGAAGSVDRRIRVVQRYKPFCRVLQSSLTVAGIGLWGIQSGLSVVGTGRKLRRPRLALGRKRVACARPICRWSGFTRRS